MHGLACSDLGASLPRLLRRFSTRLEDRAAPDSCTGRVRLTDGAPARGGRDAATRHRQYGLHAHLLELGDAHDAWPRVLLRRAGWPEERSRDHDPELRLAVLDD